MCVCVCVGRKGADQLTSQRFLGLLIHVCLECFHVTLFVVDYYYDDDGQFN